MKDFEFCSEYIVAVNYRIRTTMKANEALAGASLPDAMIRHLRNRCNKRLLRVREGLEPHSCALQHRYAAHIGFS